MPNDDIFIKIDNAILNAIEKDANSEGQATKRGFNTIEITEEKAFTPVVGQYVQEVKSFVRKGKRIRAHQRIYNGYIPIKLPSGEWRMVSRLRKSTLKQYTEQTMIDLISAAIKQEFR